MGNTLMKATPTRTHSVTAGVLSLTLALACAACVTDPSDAFGGVGGFGGSGDKGSMSATIDGMAWTARYEGDDLLAEFAEPVPASLQSTVDGEALQVTGLHLVGTETADSITFTLYSTTGFPLGTYPMVGDGSDMTAAAQITLLDQSYYNAVSGSVTLAAMDGTTVSGTFEFTAMDQGVTVVVSDGKFSTSFMDFSSL